MTISEGLGVCGFLVAFGHVACQVWFQHRQNAERVRASVLLGQHPCVQVINVGIVPVHITGVERVVGGLNFPFRQSSGSRHCPKPQVNLGPSTGN